MHKYISLHTCRINYDYLRFFVWINSLAENLQKSKLKNVACVELEILQKVGRFWTFIFAFTFIHAEFRYNKILLKFGLNFLI